MKQPLIRLGADIGGTFTDVVLEVGDTLFSAKVLTTYAAPEDGILEGMQQVCRKAGINASQIQQVIHGTTLATNALIERKGAKTALITTEGFRDVIEMRTESRFEQYDLNLELPEPLLPRQSRFTVKERLDANGAVMISLDPQDIENLATRIEAAGYESIAVGLLHSYANDAHEKLIRDVLRRRLPNVAISLSSEVSPQMREYERFNTVVANAYIKPLMKSYLERLKGCLKREGAACDIFLMHSGGGIISLQSAAEFPVRLVESGPAGGAVFAATIAAQFQLDKVLSFDMGGTTAKICLIDDQTPSTSRVFEVARSYRFKKGSGMPISIPVIDMVEIGAGGGSLASVDSLRQIRVGPESAGSEPGPACYGRGGLRPAVTDADLVLGKLDPQTFAGGSINLFIDDAKQALDREIGVPLDMDITTAALGLCEVVDENMANAARVHAVENGKDLTNYTMIAFGGAAPLHAARLCEKLGIARLLVPEGAGVGSAIGFLRAPFSFAATRSVFMRLSEFNADPIKALLRDLQDEAMHFVSQCGVEVAISCEVKAYMRYSGQGWELPIPITAEQAAAPNATSFMDSFEAEYERLFGRLVDGTDIEITVWSVNASTPKLSLQPVAEVLAADDAVSSQQRSLFEPSLGKEVKASVVQRHTLEVGQRVYGPAVIIEDETSIIIPSNRQAIRQADGTIDITTCEGQHA